jgi:hypothetical protein
MQIFVQRLKARLLMAQMIDFYGDCILLSTMVPTTTTKDDDGKQNEIIKTKAGNGAVL